MRGGCRPLALPAPDHLLDASPRWMDMTTHLAGRWGDTSQVAGGGEREGAAAPSHEQGGSGQSAGPPGGEVGLPGNGLGVENGGASTTPRIHA